MQPKRINKSNLTGLIIIIIQVHLLSAQFIQYLKTYLSRILLLCTIQGFEMFNKKELLQLRLLTKTRIDKLRSDISNTKNTETHESLETELITLVSIFTKLKRDISEAATDSLQQKMPKILIVDDVESMRLFTEKLLKEMGFRHVEEARSGEQAFNMLTKASSKEPFDIVITDWEMHGKSGLELLRDIRINESLADTQVFLLTSHGSQNHIMQAIQAGVTGYLVKPINFNILKKKLASYLPKKATAQA